jgi:hypothetical protein
MQCVQFICYVRFEVFTGVTLRNASSGMLRRVALVRTDVSGPYPLHYQGDRNPRRMVSSGLLRRVSLVRTDVSEEPGASFIRVTKSVN